MSTNKLLNYLHEKELFSEYVLIKNDNKILKSLGTIKKLKLNTNEEIKWFEMPYVLNHLNILEKIKSDTNEKPLINYLRTKDDALVCIFLRPSLTNLIDKFFYENDILKEFKKEYGGNDIYFLSKNIHQGLSPNDIIRKKRLLKIRKSKTQNNLFVGTGLDLERKDYFIQVAEMYQSLMKKKKTNSFYLFRKFWEDPRNLTNIDHKFFCAIDKITGNLNGFILLLDGIEQFIFLSASNFNGRETNAPSLLRYYVIEYFLNSKSALYINMGGVNKRKGGDESFKKSFGGESIRYSIFYQINSYSYEKLLKEMNKSFNPEQILFWK